LVWQLEFTAEAVSAFGKLDKPVQKRVKAYLDARVASGNPRSAGKRLVGEFAGMWRYRVGDYRVLTVIEDGRLVVLVVDVDHRRQVYR
jgi:mRNA interferase RelE/StbE